MQCAKAGSLPLAREVLAVYARRLEPHPLHRIINANSKAFRLQRRYFAIRLRGNEGYRAVRVESPYLHAQSLVLSSGAKRERGACAVRAEGILTALGFRHVIKHGTYVYGNFGHNRAAIKCVPAYGKTFVYTAVAGPEVRVVERLRNEIAWKL